MAFQPGYTPWNKGKIIGQKRPLKLDEIATIRSLLEMKRQVRDLAMFNLAIDSKLRGCDLIALKIEGVAAGGRVRDRASVMQRKTSSVVQFQIGSRTKLRLEAWLILTARRSGFLFPGKRDANRHLSIRQYARIVDAWFKGAGLDKSLYATHTLRRTKATILYRKTGNLRAVQLLLGHKSIENTIRYLGIEVDDALELSGQVEI
ncbi:MAG: tyrosine-type recombinase/integrase [Alphaproteobacteria bacterium]|nr:tyrosine-type recombinase/integrase [Alphaproteobacteria bacterium]